ncbi:DEAD/DEAH box helicase [Megalodesulfovibrio gigas]|uniref:Putative DEAD/DEAH box helicase n=1 Tax=Megalodesulfovibrio gigas (strain ATCC 19364 / DSM 1382 / NCIMB 9332 / VKM B-1759) TaxID=1121448 RepID=T2GE13_MEGG1|nr:DEAD/DEAH box helicase [Megalodesulfovibrio gigas]AGW14419.1 putative DEAD/DEAH box helicase [Megalodesulfovibrio gigas DSM 1382 = ATCC 19364]
MDAGNEALLRTTLQEFIKDSIPEYILESSQYIVASGGVQKISLKKGDPFWEIEGNVQGDDFQIYSPEVTINLKERRVNYFCNCPDSFSGVCRHVGATALKFLHSLESAGDEEDAPHPLPKTEWRQAFRSFFATEPEAEPGRHYLIYRFFPEPGRLQIAFFRARQNKSGLSTVHQEVTLEQIIRNPDWSEGAPQLPRVAQLIGQYIDYFGHRVEVPDGLITWLLRSIRREYYLFWRDSDQPCRIETKPMRLMLKPQLEEQGLSLDVFLGRDGKPPFSILGKEAHFYGQLPIWVCWNRGFYPVQTGLESQLVQELVLSPPVVPQADISEFLDRVWTRLPVQELYDPEAFLAHMEPLFIPASYNPKLYLDEEGSLLTLHIENIYETQFGEHSLSGPNPDLITGSVSYEGKSFLIRRDQEKEAHLAQTLQDMQFQPRSPSMWFLEPEEAIAFLLDAYPTLVQQYRIYGEKNLTRYKVRLAQPQVVAEVKSDEEEKWFTLDLEIQYDDQRVPIDKIWAAWSQGKRYVQLKDGSYTSLPEGWLKKLEHKLRALGFDPDKPPKRLFKQFEAPVLDKILEDIPDAVTDSFWSCLKEKIHSFEEVTPVEPPQKLNASLRPYQVQGLSYLNFLREYGFGGILADEMGLGKTIQTLSFIAHVVETGQTGPNLIVVPTSVLPNWEREAEKFVPHLKRLTIYGARREGMFKLIRESDLVLTTYALLRRDLEELQKEEFNSVILDEAQNIKNPNTITARSVRRLASKQRICLSGTPIENNLFELWSLFEFLMPGFLGSQHSFQRGIVKPIKDGDPETLEYLRSRVKPFILRRTKKEVAKDLPPKVENVYYCALMDEQLELYAALAKKLREQVLQDVDEKGLAKSQMSILDALLKLRQICCHPRLLKLDMPGVSTNLPSGKFDAFKDMVTDIIEEGHKVLVFSQFVQMLHIIRSWLNIQKIPFAYLDGASKDRFDQVDRFNNTPEIPIFLISLKAGGTGLNLTSADYVIHYDPWWNPAVENQATDRTHRIGQTRQVFAYKLICQNTVEEKILKLQDSKRDVAESIIPGQDAWKSLTRDDLEMLFDV